MAVNGPTGAMVTVPADTITVSVQPDLSGLGRLGTVLAGHAQAPGVAALRQQLNGIMSAPPQAVYRLAFSETANSASSTAHTVSDQLGQLRIVREYIPWGLFGLGATLLVAAGLTLVRRPPRAEGEHAPPADVGWPHAA
jgi:hypothetical protein